MGFEKHDPGLVSFEESFEMNKKDVFISSRKIYDDRLRETINQSCIRSITSEVSKYYELNHTDDAFFDEDLLLILESNLS